MSDASMTIPKDEYDILKRKADMFDQYIKNEEISHAELKSIQEALKSGFLTKAEFLKRHPDLSRCLSYNHRYS